MKIKTLNNGLKVILNQDKTKYRTKAVVFINAGGLNRDYYVDGVKHEIPYGVAHFLEHYLLEQSIYGNICDYFDKEYISNNGITSSYKTKYFISTVHDFEDNFIKLLNVINNAHFSEEQIELVKKPIISEINRKNDQKYLPFYTHMFKCLFKSDIFNKNLGDIETILNIKKEDIENFYNTFYQPSNQIIFISGNFTDDIIDLIEKTYASFKRDYPIYEVKETIEPDEVEKNNSTFKGEIKEKFVEVAYKINIKNLTPLEKNKLDYYVSFLAISNFKEGSKLFDYILKNNISLYNIGVNYDAEIMKDFIVLSFKSYTEYYDEMISLITKQVKNPILDEDDFKKWQNKTIIENINESENVEWVTDNFANNVMLYNLYQSDDIDFIKSLNLNEFKEILKKLDLTHYSIIKNDF